MGLDTSHGAYSGGYGRFNVWREAICRALGAEHDLEMDWPQRFELWPPEWDQAINPTGGLANGMSSELRDRYAMGTFTQDEMPPEPVYVLLLHEDCDGIIPSFACGPLADGLERILPRVDPVTTEFAPAWAIGGKTYDDTTAMTKQFIEGLRYAAGAGEDLVFG